MYDSNLSTYIIPQYENNFGQLIHKEFISENSTKSLIFQNFLYVIENFLLTIFFMSLYVFFMLIIFIINKDNIALDVLQNIFSIIFFCILIIFNFSFYNDIESLILSLIITLILCSKILGIDQIFYNFLKSYLFINEKSKFLEYFNFLDILLSQNVLKDFNIELINFFTFETYDSSKKNETYDSSKKNETDVSNQEINFKNILSVFVGIFIFFIIPDIISQIICIIGTKFLLCLVLFYIIIK